MKNIQTILIVVLVVIVLFQSQCSEKEVVEKIVYKDSISYVPKFDTVLVEKDIVKYVNKYIYKTDTVKELTQADTVFIVNDWSTFRFVTDTIQLDKLGYLAINDTIAFNRIVSRRVIRDFTIVQNMPFKPSKKRFNGFYLGFGVMGSQEQIEGLTGNILLTTKKHAYGVGFGINEDFNYLWRGSMFWKL